MAKKKKAPEAKAPLRGLQDTPTNTNSYIVHDPDHELAMKVTDGSVDAVLLDGVDISGGGGGGLELSTVMFNGSITDPEVFTANIQVRNNNGALWGFQSDDMNDYIIPASGNSFSVNLMSAMPAATFGFYILPGKELKVSVSSGRIDSVSGSATYVNENSCKISGSCVIMVIAD